MANVEVVAIENGHDGMQYRTAGEEFWVDAKRLKDGSTWFVESTKADSSAKEDAGE